MLGRARVGTTAQCGYERSCRSGTALCLRGQGPVSWSAHEDLRKRSGTFATRAYYYCKQCQSGFCPRDRDLRLELFSLTPGVLRMTAGAAALVSFEESSGLLHDLAGIEVSTKQVERTAEGVVLRVGNFEQTTSAHAELYRLPTINRRSPNTPPCRLNRAFAEDRPPSLRLFD